MVTVSPLTAHKFVGIADGTVLSFCPSMHLVAVSMNRTSIWVYRLDGERVYAVNNKSPIKHLLWSPDGKSFCLTGQDMLCKVYDANTGLLIHIIGPLQNDILLANWCGCNRVHPGKFTDLFQVDVLAQMPQLASETNVSTENSEFLLEVCDSGEFSISFNSLLHVRGMQLPVENIYVGHILDSLWSHKFLARSPEQTLQLMAVSLNIPHDLREYHLIIIQQTSQVLALANMVKDTLSNLRDELKAHFQLFDRYISNFSDMLNEDLDLTTQFPTPQETRLKITNSLYDILLTGVIPESQKDFWLNQLGERGIKRIAKLGSTVYDLVRKLCFAQVVAAMERIIVLLSSLSGLGQWLVADEKLSALGILSPAIQQLLQRGKSVVASVFELIWAVNKEQQLFVLFTNWAKLYIIDKLTKEDDAEAYFASVEHRDFKHTDILEYINKYLFSSRVYEFFDLRVDLEVLPQHGAPMNLETQFGDFTQNLQDLLIAGVVACIKDSISVDNVTSIEGAGEDASLVSFEEGIIVKTLRDQSVHLAKIHPQNHSIHNIEIALPERIVAAQMKSGHIVLLSSTSIFVYDLHEVFELEEVLGVANAAFYSRCSDLHQAIQSAHYIAVNDDFTLGCILDRNRRSYLVLKLESDASYTAALPSSS